MEKQTKISEKKRARNAVTWAVTSGRLMRLPCEVCGATEAIEAHHEDYSKPLEVRWLCFKHHNEAHRRKVNVEDPNIPAYLTVLTESGWVRKRVPSLP